MQNAGAYLLRRWLCHWDGGLVGLQKRPADSVAFDALAGYTFGSALLLTATALCFGPRADTKQRARIVARLTKRLRDFHVGLGSGCLQAFSPPRFYCLVPENDCNPHRLTRCFLSVYLGGCMPALLDVSFSGVVCFVCARLRWRLIS